MNESDIKLFIEMWYKRNPAHETDESGNDRFWQTAELVAREYCETLEKEPAEPLVNNEKWETLVLERIHSICMSHSHDYGLMSQLEKESLRHKATKWIYAISKDLPTAIKPEPKQPTHEEIWNKVWYEKYTRVWCRVVGYRNGQYALYHHKHMQCENYKPVIVRTKEWFIDKESRDIPPEATE